MNWLRLVVVEFIDSGVSSGTSESNARYIRFLNTTLFLFTLGQVPVVSLLVSLRLWEQLFVNLMALGMLLLAFVLNRSGRHLVAKILTITVVVANTVYFSVMFGATAPIHLWLIPGAVLSVLVFKPSEWVWTTTSVGTSMICFAVFEHLHPILEPVVRHLIDPHTRLQAAQASTIAAMALTLVLIGMMHLRFARAEAALSSEKAESDRLLRAILPDRIAEELRQTGRTPAVRHEDVSLLFADIVGFTRLAASMPAEQVVALLARIFEEIDGLIAECGVEKIKTI